MKTLRNISLLCMMLIMPLMTTAAEPVISFSAHPRLLYTQEELDAWKGDEARAAERKKILAAADALLAKGPLYVPKKGGQWIFYYSHPETGAGLEAKSLTEHWCPSTKTWHNDERTVAAYRTVLNDRLNADCVTLATAYGLTNDERYAAPVRAALLELAAIYPSLERHDRWGRKGLLAVVGGRRYCQHLTEAIGATRLAEAYDLIYNAPSLSADDRAIIEKDFFRATIDDILRYGVFAGTRNNHRSFFNTAFMSVGVALGDAKLVRESLYGSYGLFWQLKNSITKDGIWYEGTMSYHMYALSALMQQADAARRVGVDLAKSKSFKSLWTGPLQLAYPNGQFPAINDSDRTTLKVYQPTYAWGYRFFGDPLFAAYANDTAGKNAPRIQPQSRNLAAIGLANLRIGTDTSAACAFIDYGMHGEGHGHPDKLTLSFFALGQELFPDTGRITYRVPEYESWARQTIAHNTVTINGTSQRPTTGELLHFQSANMKTMMFSSKSETGKETTSTAFDSSVAFHAALTRSTQAYPGWDLRRSTLLMDHYLIDIFRVAGKRTGQIDWALHGFGRLAPPETSLEKETSSLGSKAGYQHLANIKAITAPENTCFSFNLGQGKTEKKVAVHIIDSTDTKRFTAMGIGYTVSERLPMLLRRTEGKEALFITVVDFSGTGDALKKLETFPIIVDKTTILPAMDAIGLRLTEATKRTDITIGLTAPISHDAVDNIPGEAWYTTSQSPLPQD